MRIRSVRAFPCLVRVFVLALVAVAFVALAAATPALADVGQWTWMGGPKTTNQWGVYGVQGTASAANIPGARDMPATWLDDTGALWLFGGYGYDKNGLQGELNDLWRYDPATGFWTWVGGRDVVYWWGVYGTRGTPDPNNIPGSRSAPVSWTDSAGTFWLFGGWGRDIDDNLGYLNDLWSYDPSTGMWTWESGSDRRNQLGVYGTQGVPAAANHPGARNLAVTWIDASDQLWLFGGYGYPAGPAVGWLNDLWRYNPTTDQWTWMSGSSGSNRPGIYGTKGTPDVANIPGGRSAATSWADSSGQFWLFGGTGWDGMTPSGEGALNDLWRYIPASNRWVWESGSNQRNRVGVYGTQGVPAPGNVPGARASAASWTDRTGKLWLFAGYGFDRITTGSLNDVWRYNRTTGQWTWMDGSNAVGQTGVYGTKGVPADTNMPRSRASVAAWFGQGDQLWAFGGYTYLMGGLERLSDLWRYEAPVDAAPTLGTITPVGGWSLPDNMIKFTTTYSDPDGWSDLRRVELWLRSSDDWSKNLILRYDVQTNQLWLRDPVDSNIWKGPRTPGVSGDCQNPYGKMIGLYTVVSHSGNTLTVTWAVTPGWRISGQNLLLLMRAQDLWGADTGRVNRGAWVINRMPNWLIPPALQNSTISLTGGTNGFYSFDPAYRDLDKRDDLRYLYFLIADSLPPNSAPDSMVPAGVYLKYDHSSGLMYIWNGTAWAGGVAPNTTLDVQTTNALVRFRWSSLIGFDYVTWKVSWRLKFSSTFVGTHNLYMRAIDKHGAAYNGDTGWKYKGTITITP